MRKFKWKADERTHFINTLSDEISREALASVNDPDTDLNEAVSMFVNTLHRAAEQMEVKSVNSNRRKRLQPKWWDNECEETKKRKYQALHTFKASNRDCDLALFKTLRNEFKNMCKTKTSRWKEKLRAKLVSTKSDPSTFWKTYHAYMIRNLSRQILSSQWNGLITLESC